MMCVCELRGAPHHLETALASARSLQQILHHRDLYIKPCFSLRTKPRDCALLFLSGLRLCFLFPAITVTVVKRVLGLDSSRSLQADFPTPGLFPFPLHQADSKPMWCRHPVLTPVGWASQPEALPLYSLETPSIYTLLSPTSMPLLILGAPFHLLCIDHLSRLAQSDYHLLLQTFPQVYGEDISSTYAQDSVGCK